MTVTDEQIEKKVKALTRPSVDVISLNLFERLTLPVTENILFKTTETERLVIKRVAALQKQPAFKELTELDQQSAITLVNSGLTQEEALTEIEEPAVQVNSQAEFDALPSGTRFRDSDGTLARKK